MLSIGPEHIHDAVIDDRRVRYLDVGEGGLCVLLVHGLGGCWQHWRQIVSDLARHARVLALDLPGFGASEPAAGAVSLEGFADLAATLARSMDCTRVVLAGHSLGGPVAVRFAARHPDLAAGIVLVAGAVYQFSALLGLREVARYARSCPRETLAIAAEAVGVGLPMPERVRGSIVNSKMLRQIALAPYVRDPQALSADAVRTILAGAGARGVRPTIRAIGRSDPFAGIEHVACPILSLAGDADRISPPADTERFQREVPRARTVVLEHCCHMPMLERPRALTGPIEEFIKGETA
jgi:pimeloyl-ACP methyl ester carboxylesterase